MRKGEQITKGTICKGEIGEEKRGNDKDDDNIYQYCETRLATFMNSLNTCGQK